MLHSLIERAYCFIRKMVCLSRSRPMIIDHCSGTVYAITIAMMVSRTSSAARVKPASERPRCARLQIHVWNMVERLAWRFAFHVDDAGLAGGLGIRFRGDRLRAVTAALERVVHHQF